MEEEDYHKINLGNENIGNGHNPNNFMTFDHSKLHGMKIPHEHAKHNVDIQTSKGSTTAKPELPKHMEHYEKPKVPGKVPENVPGYIPGNINSENLILKDSWGEGIIPNEPTQQSQIHNHPKSSYRYLKCNIILILKKCTVC